VPERSLGPSEWPLRPLGALFPEGLFEVEGGQMAVQKGGVAIFLQSLLVFIGCPVRIARLL